MSRLIAFISKNKKTLVPILVLGLFFSFALLTYAQQAQLSTDSGSSVQNQESQTLTGAGIANAIFGGLSTAILVPVITVITLVIGILASIAGFVFYLIGGIFGRFIVSTFSIKIIPATDGIEFVNLGWQFSRDFVSILFIVILAFIGLATILRLENYQAQKTVPILIIMALLINFSGVIVGFIVDIGSLVTNFFIEKVADLSVENLKEHTLDRPLSYLKDTFFDMVKNLGSSAEISVFLTSIIYGLSLIAFSLFGCLIFFVVMLIFFLRVIILWVLTIIAPFAFAAYILPVTRNLWSQWWKQLIQWSIIGIPLGLFLVLAKYVFEADTGAIFTPPTILDSGGLPWGEPGFNLIDLISNMFQPLIGLLLMLVGILLSMQIAPAGANTVINWGQKTGIKAGNWARNKGTSFTRERLAKSERVQKIARRMEQASSKDASSRTSKYLIAPFAPVVRATGRKLGSENLSKIKVGVNQAETAAEKMDERTVASKLKGNIPIEEKIGYINAKIKSGDIDDVAKAYGKNFSTDFVDIYEHAEKLGQHKEMQTAFPNIILTPTSLERSAAATLHNIEEKEVRQQHINVLKNQRNLSDLIMKERVKAVKKIKPDKVKQISISALKDLDISQAILRSWDGRQMSELYKKHGQEAAELLENHLKRFSATDLKSIRSWLEDNNPQLLRYLDTDPGQELFGKIK